MATEAQIGKQKGKTVDRNISTLNFQFIKKGGPDNELLTLVNAVSNKPENSDDPPTLFVRKLLKRACRLLLGEPANGDVEFFKQYIQAAESRN